MNLVAAIALASSALVPCVNAAEFNVTCYGAKPDGTTDNTAAIQKAIDDCAAKGGGRVLVPGGGRYMTYTLNLRNNVELHIDRGATAAQAGDRYNGLSMLCYEPLPQQG